MPKQNSNTTSTALQHLEKTEFLVVSTTNAMDKVADRVTELHGRFVPGNPEEGEKVEWRAVQQENVRLLRGSARNVREKDQGFRLARAKATALSDQRVTRLDTLGP